MQENGCPEPFGGAEDEPLLAEGFGDACDPVSCAMSGSAFRTGGDPQVLVAGARKASCAWEDSK